jgi:hypothetical protein
MTTSKSEQKQTALITGAAKRIGRATALALAKNGLNVVVHYATSKNEALQLVEEIRSIGSAAWSIDADLADPKQAEALVTRSVEFAGSLDVVINNASVFPSSRLMDFTAEELDYSVRINAFSPLLISREFAKHCQSGVIVNLLDSRIKTYDREHAAYHLSKRMFFSVTRMLAMELAPKIRVNGVAPGLVLPPIGKDQSYLEKRKHTNPLERYGDVSHVTDAISFLIENTFITGQVIYVDGGRHLKNAVYG